MSDALFRAHERVEAAIRELDAARHDLMEAVVEANASQRERWEETRRAIQANDEAVTGTPCCDPRPVVIPHAEHQFAAIQCSGGVCSEAMDDLEGLTTNAVTRMPDASRSCNLTNCGGRCGICKP